MKTDSKNSLRRRELELQLRLAILDLMDHLDTTSFVVPLAADSTSNGHYLVVGQIDQLAAHVATLKSAPPADDDSEQPERRH